MDEFRKQFEVISPLDVEGNHLRLWMTCKYDASLTKERYDRIISDMRGILSSIAHSLSMKFKSKFIATDTTGSVMFDKGRNEFYLKSTIVAYRDCNNADDTYHMAYETLTANGFTEL